MKKLTFASQLPMRLAAIDIGSNSIHLVIVNVKPGGRFEIIAREKEMVRLAAGALAKHHLSQERMELAFQTLVRFAKFARARGAKKILATATSAVREATNKNFFLARVKELTDIEVEVLSGVEEARLIALAVTEAIHLDNRRALIIDIGGGSTEFIVTDGAEPLLLNSMKLGAVRLAESERLSDPVKNSELAYLRKMLRAQLARTAQEINETGFEVVIGTSGTILNMVNLAAQMNAETEEATGAIKPFSQSCTFEELASANAALAEMTEKARARVPGLDVSRADIIIAGGQLLEAILRAVGAREIITCDWALREGSLLDYISKHLDVPHADLGMTNLADKELDVRDKTILSIARRYDYQPIHSHQVARLAGLLFDQLTPLHHLSPEDRALMQYAAILHDIGYHISHSGHHRHAYYLIENSELPGFSAIEVAIIANIVRFHRGPLPRRKSHPEYAALNKSSRMKVLKLIAILRIADALDRAHSGVVANLTVTAKSNHWYIGVEASGDCELELWYANSTKEDFEKIFDVKIKIGAQQDIQRAFKMGGSKKIASAIAKRLSNVEPLVSRKKNNLISSIFPTN